VTDQSDRPRTIEETIKLLGVSEKTVRRMLAGSILHEQERDPRGRILISVESIAAAAEQLQERRREPDESQPADIILASQAATFDRTIERLTQMIDDREAELRNMTTELATLRAEQRYLPAPGRMAELEQENATLKAELTVMRELTDHAKQGISKGWIRRIFGRGQDTDR